MSDDAEREYHAALEDYRAAMRRLLNARKRFKPDTAGERAKARRREARQAEEDRFSEQVLAIFRQCLAEQVARSDTTAWPPNVTTVKQ